MTQQALRQFIEQHPRLFVLTGAGCSTRSGIPDYRDADGAWKRPAPVMLQAFLSDPAVRQRYWARSMAGWPQLQRARPNDAHRALASLERRGALELLLTQNVDRLHHAAGSSAVVELHGRIDVVRCLACERRLARADFQQQLARRNPQWVDLRAASAPDGDAELQGLDFSTFDVPACEHCGGMLKPDVVFFGESVPPERVDTAMQALARADAMLVLGSSLMVYSGYRFARAAALAGKPIAAVNMGRTRADELLSLKLQQDCGEALGFLS
jgi:NAD-dependent SIR2 family protein deacetylase